VLGKFCNTFSPHGEVGKSKPIIISSSNIHSKGKQLGEISEWE